MLAELAEATGGVALETVGQRRDSQRADARTKGGQLGRRSPRNSAGMSFETDSAAAIPEMERLRPQKPDDFSALSQVTVSEWLENRIKEGTVEGLRAAMQVDPANARVTAHLGRRLADQASNKTIDPDEARRARGEADFLTSRAQKLAPNNDEVKKLRDEVVKLLGLKTN